MLDKHFIFNREIIRQVYIGSEGSNNFYFVEVGNAPIGSGWLIIRTMEDIKTVYGLNDFTRKNLKGKYDSILHKAQAIAKLLGINHDFLAH